MKKILSIAMLLIVPLLTGCTNIDTQLTINNDKSATIVSSLTYKGDLSDKTDITALTFANNYKKFLDKDYNIDTAYSTNLSTVTGSKSISNIENSDIDMSSLGFVSNLPGGRFIEVKKNFLVTSFNIDATYNLKEQINRITALQQKTVTANITTPDPEYLNKFIQEGDVDIENAEPREDFLQNLDEDTKNFVENNIAAEEPKSQESSDTEDLAATFSVKLPSYASFNNADSVEGNVYIWNIKQDEPTEIKLQYVKYSGFAILFIILAGIALLVLLARKIIKHDSQKRIDN